MRQQLSDLGLGEIVDTCRRLHAPSLVVFGSATGRDVGSAADVDLHVVVPRLTAPVHSALLRAAENAARSAAARTGGGPWRVELRHGPFKPAPESGDLGQIHLVVDDLWTVEASPWALQAHRFLTGRRVLGATVAPSPCPVSRQLREARSETLRWRRALLMRRIPFRHWELSPSPRLVGDTVRAVSTADLRCLLRAAGASSDLHARLALLRGVFRSSQASALRPLLEQVRPQRECMTAETWDLAAAAAVAVLDERLSGLRVPRGSPSGPWKPVEAWRSVPDLHPAIPAIDRESGSSQSGG
jgi:hypothetical protein